MADAKAPAMKTDVYARNANLGFSRVMGAEVVDEWENGCRIRSEEELLTSPGTGYYVTEGDNIVAVHLKQPDGQGPFDYAAEIDRSDVRALADL